MKKIGVLAVALAAAFLLVGAASAEMYVEGYLGGTAAANMGQNFVVHDTGIATKVVTSSNFNLNYPGTTDCVLGGVKLGTWFVKEGFAGWSGYPDWCKYFGFYTDFSYQRLEMSGQRLNGGNHQLSGHGSHLGLHVRRPLRLLSGFGSALRPPAALCGRGAGRHVHHLGPEIGGQWLEYERGEQYAGRHRPVGGVRDSLHGHEERFPGPLLQISLCPAQLLL